MHRSSYIHILSAEEGKKLSSFYVYLPTGEDYYVRYKFVYIMNPVDPELSFGDSSNVYANCEFYRICGAEVGKLTGEEFSKCFAALQGGEIGLAFREEGAGDFIGGFHGDELVSDLSLSLDGSETPLNKPFFGVFEEAVFSETSYIYRCNTPSEKLIFHKQRYFISGSEIKLEQYIEWISDAKMLSDAFSPMLTAYRIDPDDSLRILTDTVEFYDRPDGELITVFDTTLHGTKSLTGKGNSEIVCRNTPSAAVRVYGKKSGYSAEAGYRIIDDSIPQNQISTCLCIRYAARDNKIYFDIGAGTTPVKGTVWKSEIYYRLSYFPAD